MKKILGATLLFFALTAMPTFTQAQAPDAATIQTKADKKAAKRKAKKEAFKAMSAAEKSEVLTKRMKKRYQLTEQQMQPMKDAQLNFFRKMEDVYPLKQTDKKSFRTKRKDLRAEREQAMLALFDDTQKKKYLDDKAKVEAKRAARKAERKANKKAKKDDKSTDQKVDEVIEEGLF